ncbi:hypothetical protein Ferp_0480 [Ferroglobus placidus DSM 10642]|uniref:Uncharacterized protein n=2 Tax=Ferroglobus placidus TaxID=54261 RepID=D3S321_FERPA|nr:hypothetical protein Ferp_0480 [Ferroglobus placidus DSM 10642]
MSPRRAILSLIGLITLIEPCLAVPPPPAHVALILLIAPVIVNYFWNFTILGLLFRHFNIGVISRKFALFIAILTLLGLCIDGFTYLLGLNFFADPPQSLFLWFLLAGILLFITACSLTRLVYRLPKKICFISGLVYGAASNPAAGILLAGILLGSLIPPYWQNFPHP